MRKHELIWAVCGSLDLAGVTDEVGDRLTMGNNKIKSLRRFREGTLEGISNLDYKDHTIETITDAFKLWEELGFIDSADSYEEDDNGPTLHIGAGQYLRLVDGWFFEITGEGRKFTDYFINQVSLRPEIEFYKRTPEVRGSKYIASIMYANMLDIGFSSNTFRHMFDVNRDKVQAFFVESMRYWDLPYEYDWDLFDSTLDESTVDFSKFGKVYQLTDSGKSYIRCIVEDNIVSIEYESHGENGFLTFKAPKLFDGTRLEGVIEDKIYNDFITVVNCGSVPSTYVFLLMLLRYIGISIGFNGSIENTDVLEPLDGVSYPVVNITRFRDISLK